MAPPYRGFLKKSMNDLPTPALLIDLDIFEHNLQTLAAFMKEGRDVPTAWEGAQVSGDRQAATGLRREGDVRRQAR